MSGLLGEYDQVLPSVGFSKSEEKILSCEIQDIDAFNDETFGEGCEEDDWESSHEKMALLLEDRSTVGESNAEDSMARSVSRLMLDNEEPEDPAIMTYGKKHNNSSKFSPFFNCNSPILTTNKNIWGMTSTPIGASDSGLESILRSLSSKSSQWDDSPQKALTMEEVEKEMFGSSRGNSSSSWETPNSNKFERGFFSSPGVAPAMDQPFGGWGVPNLDHQAMLNKGPLPPPQSQNWNSRPMELKGAHTLDEVERDMRQPNINRNSTQLPIGTPRINKLLPNQMFGPKPGVGPVPGHIGVGPSHLPPHPILNPHWQPYGMPPAMIRARSLANRNCISPSFSHLNQGLDNDNMMPRQKYIYHPLLQKTPKRVPEYNMYSYQNYGGGQHPSMMSPQHHLYGGEEDEYAGLMTQREKEWLVKIQMLQLHTNNPYLDDYYYTTYTSKKLAKEKEMIVPEINKLEARIYEPTQFEGSLGKLQAVSINFPRKVLDMGVCVATNEDGPTHTYPMLRRALQCVERLYTLLLEVDDEDKRMMALPKEAHEPHLATKATFVGRLYSGLSIATNHNPASLDFFTQIMSVRKGRTLFLRALPYFDLGQQVNLLECLFLCLGPVLKKDTSEQVLLSKAPVIMDVIDRCSLKELIRLANSLVSAKYPFHHTATFEFAQLLIKKMLGQAQKLRSIDSLEEEEDQSSWNKLALLLEEVLSH